MGTLYAGVDLGGTNMSVALASADGVIVVHDKQPTQSYEGPHAVLGRMGGMINDLAGRAGAKPAAVGIGIPGLVDLARGSTRFLPNLPTHWRDIPVRGILQPLVGCPVHLLNDARAATLGELTFGHGKRVKSMIFFGLGTGVGGGVALNGELWLGPLGAAGELGHQTIIADGPLCGCGNRGCLETLVSGPAIAAEGVRLMLSGQAPRLHEITGGDVSKVTPATMAQAAQVDGAPSKDRLGFAVPEDSVESRDGRVELKKRVLESTDILEVIGQSVALQQRGKDFVGLCPFHEDKNPSMYVVPSKGIFHCFACKASGNVIDFVMRRDHVDFDQALRTLAARAGIELPEESRPPQSDEQQKRGDPAVLHAIYRAGEWLGIGAANIIVALHPELVVIGGGVAEMGDLLLDPVRLTIRRRVGMFPTDSVRVERSILGDQAGLFGGIALAVRGGVKASGD